MKLIIKNIKYKRLLPYLFLVIIPILFFYRILLGNTFLVGDFTGSDLLDLHLPFKQILHENYNNGRIPLWEPNLSMGFPVLAEGQSGVFYLPNIIFSFLPPVTSLNLSILFNFILASLFMYIYARSLGLSVYSSLFSAVTFSLSAFFIARIKHLNIIEVSAWVPFVFFCIKKTFDEKKYFYTYLGAVGVTMQFLAGHPQMTYYSILVYGLYITYEFFQSDNYRNFKERFSFCLKVSLILFVLPVMISAIQILPTYELAQLSWRVKNSIESANSYPFTLESLFTFVFPYFFGNPALGSYGADIRKYGIFWENVLYIGIIPLIFAVFSIIYTLKKKNAQHLRLFIFLSLISFIIMLGSATPLYSILYKLLPGFSLFRFPVRFNLFLIFSLSILAGFGAEELSGKLVGFRIESRKKSIEKFRIIWPFKYRQNKAIFLIVAFLDLLIFSRSYISYVENDKLNKTTQLVKDLEGDKSLFRLINFTQYSESPYQVGGWKQSINGILALREIAPPNNNILYNLQTFNERGWFEGGLSVAKRNEIEQHLLGENIDKDIFGKILGMYNVKYAVSFSDDLGKDFSRVKEYGTGKIHVINPKLYENNKLLPRAYYVPQAEVIGNKDGLFNRIFDVGFNPETTVLLSQDPNVSVTEYKGDIGEFRKNNNVEIVKYGNYEVDVKAKVKDSGFLILNEIDYPGWKVRIDGVDNKILNANYIVRAVELTPGEHLVNFYYDSFYYKLGLTISACSLILLVILMKRSINV